MKERELLDILKIAERLKDTLRHCYTSKGRRESVAEHTFMMTIMCYFLSKEFENADMTKVMKMCIIHDLGECFTGDIPTFNKTDEHEKIEQKLLDDWVDSLPPYFKNEMAELYIEMNERKTIESKIYKAIDSLEAVIQHNFSDINTWEGHEYNLNLTYAFDKVEFSAYLTSLRNEIKNDTLKKIEEKN